MIPGLRVTIDERAVVVAAERPLRMLSSAVLRGGLVEARLARPAADTGFGEPPGGFDRSQPLVPRHHGDAQHAAHRLGIRDSFLADDRR